MSLSLSTASTALARLPLPTAVPVAKPVPSQQPSASTTTDNDSAAQETSALNRVLGGYRADLVEGEPTAALSSLARQITADAKLAGRTASLPIAPAASAASGHLNALV